MNISFSTEEKEKEENLWRGDFFGEKKTEVENIQGRKIFDCDEEEERRRKISWRRKNCCGLTGIEGFLRGLCGP